MNAPITPASRPYHTACVSKDLEATRTPNSRAGGRVIVTLTIHWRSAKQLTTFTRWNTR